MINSYKRKIDNIYKICTEFMNKENLDIANSIKDYIYGSFERIIGGENDSFNSKVISELTFKNIEHDIRLINEALNKSDKIPFNNVYLPKLDNKTFHKRFAYPLVELTFNSNYADINELTEQEKMDGESRINYDCFINHYISLYTYIMNADYVGKNFIENTAHNEDSQDFSNSNVIFNYRGILLIETCGEYAIVSHETITMAGYDVPESVDTKLLDSSVLELYKKFIVLRISYLAESYRDEDSSLNQEIILKHDNKKTS